MVITTLVMADIVPIPTAAAGKVSHGCRLLLGDLLELFSKLNGQESITRISGMAMIQVSKIIESDRYYTVCMGSTDHVLRNP